ncbi:unnamed protein product, partial [marine sediment metagenome]
QNASGPTPAKQDAATIMIPPSRVISAAVSIRYRERQITHV